MRDVEASRAAGNSIFDILNFAFEDIERLVFICKHA